jgi:ketosteroid isomerase-like protein
VRIIAAMSVESGDPAQVVAAMGVALLQQDLVELLRDDEVVEKIRGVIGDHVAADLECHMVAPGYTGPRGELSYRGIEGFVDAWREWTEAYESYTVEIEEITEGPGGRVLTLGRQRGITRTGGVEVEESAAAVWTVHDGHVVRVEFHLDPEAARRSAGLAD